MITKTMQRLFIAGWLMIAMFLMSDFANANVDGFPTIITQQGQFTIIETGNSVHVCTRQGAFVICN